MTFKKDFDEIIIDLCGELPKKEKIRTRSGICPEYDQYTRALLEEIDSINSFDPNHRERMAPHNLIQKMCHRTVHKCLCKKQFNIWIYTTNRVTTAEFNFEMDQVLNYTRKLYFCPFCGQRFDVLNGDILRIELKDQEVENYYHSRR